jgi:hypothetical protein
VVLGVGYSGASNVVMNSAMELYLSENAVLKFAVLGEKQWRVLGEPFISLCRFNHVVIKIL